MTDWQRRPYSLPDPPDTPALTRQTFESYRRALTQIGQGPEGIKRLSDLAIEVSAKLQEQTTSAITSILMTHAQRQDQLGARSTRTVDRSPVRSDPRPEPSRQPAAWELLSASRRQGPRLAQKLVLAEVRRQNRGR